MKRVLSVLCTALPLFLAGACTTSAEDVESGVGNQPESAPVDAPRVRSWIGAMLRTQRESGEEIREYPSYVEIADTLPSTPAHGVLSDEDVFVSVDGRPVTTAEEVIAIVSQWPVGDELSMVVRRKKKELKVLLRPVERPTYEEYLQKLYIGKPMPSLKKRVSLADVQRDGGIVPGSQCVMKGKKACPPFGRSRKTDLSVGKATVVLFWSTWLTTQSRLALTRLRFWDTQFGKKGLKIVAVTTDLPSSVAKYFKDADTHPPMTVFAISSLELGVLKYIEKESPSALVLNENGVVRAVCLWGKRELSDSCERTVSDLLVEVP